MTMSLKEKQAANGLAVESVSRKPLQGRSRASLERMLATARELMVERGNEDFTLQDVSKRGNVSIGSIYLRFESKENLVRAVIAQFMEDMAREENAMLDDAMANSTTLDEFVPRFVQLYAEILRKNAPLLRLAMHRASHDELVSKPGKDRALAAASASVGALLAFRGEFGGNDHQTRASSSFHIIFATLARELSLGSTGESANNYDWELLKRELGRMCIAYLRSE